MLALYKLDDDDYYYYGEMTDKKWLDSIEKQKKKKQFVGV